MSQKIKEKWFALGVKGRGSQGGRRGSGQLWGRVLAWPLLSFSFLPLGTKGTPAYENCQEILPRISCLGFSRTIIWVDSTVRSLVLISTLISSIPNCSFPPLSSSHSLIPLTSPGMELLGPAPGSLCALCLQGPLSSCLWKLAYFSKPRWDVTASKTLNWFPRWTASYLSSFKKPNQDKHDSKNAEFLCFCVTRYSVS